MNEPDPRLLAALRHAPDADLQAPAALRDAILAQARQAVAPPARAGLWQRWQTAWSAPARWGASGAFASLVMAGVVTMLWQEETPGPAAEQRVEAPAVPPAAAPAVAPTAAAPATAPRAVEARQPDPQPRLAQKAAPPFAPPAQPAPQRQRDAMAVPAPIQAAADNAVAGAQSAAPPPAAPHAESALPTAPAPLRAPARALRTAERLATAPAMPDADDDVQWQQPQPTLPPARVWLRQAIDRVAGPWQPAPGAAPPAGAPVVRWQRSGQPTGPAKRAWIDTRAGTQGLLWCDETGCQQAPLKEETPR